MSRELLRIERLDFYNNSVKILDNMKLNVNRGEIVSLLGSNGAGKSLIIKILKGDVKCDGGLFYFNEQLVKAEDLKSNKLLKMHFIESENAFFEGATVIEFIYILRNNRSFIISNRDIRKKYRELGELLKIRISPDVIVDKLDKIGRLIVQLAKAVSQKAELIIIDDLLLEASDAQLQQVNRIFDELRRIGISVLFATRHIEPYIDFSDRFIVIRQGTHALTALKHSFDKNVLEAASIGHKYEKFESYESMRRTNEVFLEARNLSYRKILNDFSFRLYKGEILGFHVYHEAKAAVLADLLTGIKSCDRGELYLNREKLQLKSVYEAINKNIHLIPEYDITFPNLSIQENLLIPNLKKMSNFFGIIDKSKTKFFVNEKSNRIGGKKGSSASFLSKNILIQRVLGDDPVIYIFINPLKNMDVVASNMLIDTISGVAKNGNSALIFSSSGKTLHSICDHIILV